MENHETVIVEPVKDHPDALWLRWAPYVAEADIRPAFHELTRRLDEAHSPVQVLVDLRQNPRLPLQTTIFETMNGPFLHPNMGLWLVVGTNPRAEIIATVITRVGRMDSILWYKTEAEALRKLEALEASRIKAWA